MSKKLIQTNRKNSKQSFEKSRSFDDVKNILPCNINHKRSVLYDFVYSSAYSLIIVALLLISFLLQGVENVYAETTEVTEEVSEEEIEPEVEEVEEEISETETETEIDTESDLETKDTPEELEEEINEDSATTVEDEKTPEVTEDESVQENDNKAESDNDDLNESDPGNDSEVNENETEAVEEIIDAENNVSTSTANETNNSTEDAETQVETASSSDTNIDLGFSTTTASSTQDNNNSNNTTSSTADETATSTNSATSGNDNQPSDTASTTNDTVGENTEDFDLEQNGNPDTEDENQEGFSDDNQTEASDESIEAENNDNTSAFEENQSTSTGEVLGESTTTIQTVGSSYSTHDNEYVFNKTSCVSVGEGVYHCSKDNGALRTASEQVFSEIGKNANYEIFIRTDDGIEQITDNNYDDSSPKYDEGSNRLVWQRLIDGRYHIIVYDLKDEVEEQVTSGSQNHMEPAIAGGNIVWQQWDGSDWEIILFDGKNTKQLTDNDVQDLAPVIEDEYVVWTAVGENEQLVYVHSLETGATQTIEDHEGGAITNPRFVLVYDTKFDNGDVITKGYDPETGLSSSLAAVPMSLPVDIPPPDSTGETKALIQNKPPQKEDFSELSINSTGSNDNDNDNDKATTTSTSVATSTEASIENSQNLVDDLVVASSSVEVVPAEPLILTEFDLIVDASKDTTVQSAVVVASTTATST